MKKSEKELFNKSIIRSFLVLLALFSFMMGVLTIIESLTNTQDNKESLLTYEEIGKINYKIHLQENPLYDETYTENNVISKYIDMIELEFNYDLYTSKKIDLENNYYVKATLINTFTQDNKEKVFLEKEYKLLKEQSITKKDTSKINKTEIVNIDYNLFNDVAREIRKEAGLATKAILKVEFILKNEIELVENDTKFNSNKTMSVEIPLLENITSMTKLNEFNEKENLYSITQNNINVFQLIVGIILLIVSVGFIYTALKMFLDISNISKYLIKRNKILKRFGDIIAETSTKPELKGLEIMEITNIIDLVNIEDELRIPIIYYETIKDRESWFIINHNNKVYRYILKKKNKNSK